MRAQWKGGQSLDCAWSWTTITYPVMKLRAVLRHVNDEVGRVNPPDQIHQETERAEISAVVSLGMLTQREVPYLRHRSTQ